MNNKIVITGIGLVTSLGTDVESTWENLKEGRSGVRKVTLFDVSQSDTQIAAEVDSAKVEEMAKEKIPRRIRKQMTRTTQMSTLAAIEAIEDSKIDFEKYNKARVAVILGVITTSYYNKELEKDNYYIVKTMPNAPGAWISILYGLQGPSFNVSTACASSAYAITLGKMMIETGQADVVIVGGADSQIEANYFKGFNQIMAMSTNNDNPEGASCPFSKTRDGFVMGEGAGVMILESEKSAKERNANIYGELAGAAITSEAADITAPQKDGAGMCITMQEAIKNAGVNVEDVDYINAHGTSTNLNDKYETFAIKECFKEHAKELAVSSTKSMHGHTLAAAGAVEAILTILSVKNNIVLPTINYTEVDEELDLDYVPNKARTQKVNIALSNSFGFGGHNATLVFKKYED